ncbi:hypothetical protein INT47_013269 [Mucor saturninus]|uniref:Reverse transcriptase domain-containing protein n=1 Tax=Mucor saturninus TaxID=64648 RepID=A0A8H7QEW9_9FUNG|nr:hypothetical protein INT47_013269 [Mucor saturninus]
MATTITTQQSHIPTTKLDPTPPIRPIRPATSMPPRYLNPYPQFNYHIHHSTTSAFGDSRTTTRGTCLLQWMHQFDVICLNQVHAYGIPTFIKHMQTHIATSIIDLFLTDDFNLPSMPVIHSSLSLQSPHKAVSIDLSFLDITPETHPHPRRIWNLSRLKEPDTLTLLNNTIQLFLHPFQQHIRHLLHDPNANHPNINDLVDQFNKHLYLALDLTVGSKQPINKQKSWFWTPALQSLVDQRERTHRTLQKTTGLHRPHILNKYNTIKQQLKTAIQRRKNETWRDFTHTLSSQPYHLTLRAIKAMRNKRRSSPTYTSPKGPTHAANEMAQQLATTFDGSIRNHNITNKYNALPTPLDPNTFPSPFTIDTVQAALTKLPSRKAPGPDHLKAEILQATATTILPTLCTLFSLCWYWSTIPSIWCQAQVVPIYKKGNPNDPANYRPISLTSHIRKLMEHCLHPLIDNNSPPLDVSQGGFRSQRSALDQVNCLQQITYHHKRHVSEPVMVCLDIKSAYDTLLQQLFNAVSISVLIAGSESKPFHPTTGVLQGSVLSPILYSIYINTLPQTLRLADQALNYALHHLPPPLLPGITLNSLLYADDIILIGTRESIPVLLQVAERASFDLGFRWNPSKCVVLAPPSSAPRIYYLYDTPLPHQSSFRYLGVPFSNLGKINTNELAAHNRQAGLAALFSLVPLGLNPYGLPPKLLIQLYKQFIRPTMEYGLAIAQISNRQLLPIQQTQHQALRKMFGGHPTSEIEVIQKLTGLPTMYTRASILEAKYIHRSQYQPPDSLLAQLLPRMEASTTPWARLKRHNQLWPLLNTSTLPTHLTTHQFMLQQIMKKQQPGSLASAIPNSSYPNPILQHHLNKSTQYRIIRWLRGWIPGKPISCPCNEGTLTRQHIIHCRLFNTPEHPTESYTTYSPLNLHLLTALPSPQMEPTERTNIAEHWNHHWPLLLRTVHTLDSIVQDAALPHLPAANDLFLHWLNNTKPPQIIPNK